MAEREVRERDILVAANEYAYVQDLTKGDIVLYVGPTKISLSNTERLVELKAERFVPVRSDDTSLGVSPFVSASSAQYIVLENPPKDPAVRPLKGSNASIELLTGRKIVVPGPATFPLWPGQRAKVVDGHSLREDEYLIVRVYDRVEALEHPIGTELLIEGTDHSFYIPRTGLEVLPSDRGYVRKAWHLKKGLGLHLRVVKPFIAGSEGPIPEGSYAAGQEIFLADREGFFFPSESLEVIRTVTAVPLAEREGLYLRDVRTGRVFTVAGPCNYLPDPTQVEVVTRALDKTRAALYGLVEHDPKKAIAIHVPPGAAIMVTSKSKREVVRGPKTQILSFDEDLEVLRLSTGKPKSDEVLLPACFLQIEGNKVSDVVRVRTADHVELEITLAYRVSFITQDGEPEKWFNVRNYVDLLCDHGASLLRAAARGASIDTFHAQGTEILRSAILGEKRAEGPRAGRMFDENGMWVYDVEVLDLAILDEEVDRLLGDAQRAAITAEIDRRRELLRLAAERLKEEVERELHQARRATLIEETALAEVRRTAALAAASTVIECQRFERIEQAKSAAEAATISARARLEVQGREQALEAQALEAKVGAFQAQMAAIQPELIATLKMLGNQQLAAELTRHLSPLAILGGESVADVVERLVAGLPIGTASDGIRGIVARDTGHTGPSPRG
ncbi:MAG: hypothetical protein IT384_02200 [Deltaproteobacteria bacterium]|nr:hypothetical protein [Deltaproteobacteria bacterium]